eukprot:Nitzschia sp. Nitz4//scaffold1_size375055//59402//60610//NITZ4_000224-RA/size375055-processed-gene-0.305-mRNA-1//1//CDS//3329540889//3599//frame0
MMEVRDSVYSFEIARRAVGRAAVHLGIDTMSETALDVLADVLLCYLHRVGRTLSHLVEASGRTSAHSNFLDALQACELVAAPAVERLHMRDTSGGEGELFANGGEQPIGASLTSDWRGLAAFLFGPRWMEDAKEEEETTPEVQGAGGKQGPAASGTAAAPPKKAGWQAPYLDEVIPFPRASEQCANPHPLPPYVGLSLHRVKDDDLNQGQANAEELDELPDGVFTKSWGNLPKRKRSLSGDAAMDVDTPSEPPAKQAKRSKDSTPGSSNDNKEPSDDSEVAEPTKKKPLGIPSFYPPFPPTRLATSKESRTVVDVPPVQPIDQEDANTRAVRSSLVAMGQYWGSQWDAPASKKTETNLSVPQGRGESGDQPGSSAVVVPLGRASGSRVSRILEGSMDAPTML